MASSSSAASRTLRVSANSCAKPPTASPTDGPSGTRPREGFSPTSPHQAAGMRIEPPPSLAWAIGTARDATSAAAPPLDPPGPRAGSQGLRVGP